MLKPILPRRFNRLRIHIVRPAAIAVFALLGGCSIVGPQSIGYDRTDYNEVIQSTAVEQTLLNILRVQNKEMPVFMDVTEVDAARTFTGSVSGGASSIGATPNFKSQSAGTISGLVGSIGGTAQYQEAPTVRYQPVLGQNLIAQVATPLSVTSFVNFLNSIWPLTTVFILSINSVTPGYDDAATAVNALAALDQFGAVRFAATSPEKPAAGASRDVTVQVNNSEPGPDSVTIYFQNDSLRFVVEATIWRRRSPQNFGSG